MADWIDDLPLEDDLQLDLLVDNELSETQRQRLLTSLEGEPERWRDVALRYVEAQMLTAGVGRRTEETRDSEPSVRAAAVGGPQRRRDLRNRWFMVLAMGVAFGCGLIVEAWRDGAGAGAEQPVAVTDDADDMRESRSSSDSPSMTPAPSSTRRQPATARRSAGGRSMKVPMRLVRASEGTPTWSPRVRLTASRERQLQQAGLAVQRRPGTVRIPLGGERYVMMPAQHLQFVRRVRYRI